MGIKKMPDATLLRKLLAYDPETGLLIWKQRNRTFFKSDRDWKRWNTQFSGKIAFHVNHQGYYQGTIMCVSYMAHRVIWKMHYGEDPGHIDHINGRRDDNRLINLRVAGHGENAKNAKLYKSNKSGVCGVSKSKALNKWHAYIRANGKRINLGFFSNFDEAVAVRRKAESKYGFHPNHGRAS